MASRCDDCGKRWPETDKEIKRAAKRPRHWCHCPTDTLFVWADKYPDVFGEGYENQSEWAEKYVE